MIRNCFRHLYGIKRERIPPTPDGDMRLHRLERPVPWPNEIWPRVDRINLYPDYPPLYKRIAVHLGVKPEQIVLGNGIEDLVRTLVLLCCDPGDGFAFTWPTCKMFEIYAQVFGAKPLKIETHPSEPLTASRIAAFAWGASLMLLPNPGQPVETCYGLDDLRLIARECKKYGTTLAIDEAYYGFGAPTALPLIDEFDNVVVLRTMSKAFGAAGLRVGYAIGQQHIIKPLDAIRPSGEIAGPSLRAATRLLASWPDVIEPGVREICAGRDWFREALTSAGFCAVGSVANHVLIDLKSAGRMRRVREELLARGIHVKGGFPSPLEAHLLVTAGPVEMMKEVYDRFIEVVS